ncbi:MAG: hypothetical protein KDB84_00395, partial [Flavobacteriales bacterium]|nr:hypothetical protein [Flavobacteriales bacterium]
LTVTGANGCTSMASAEVMLDANAPEVSATGGMLDCDSGTLQLTSFSDASGATYAWTGPNGFSSMAQDPIVNTVGDYTVTVTASNGCSASFTVSVTENDCDKCPPLIISCGPDVTIECGTSDHPYDVGHPIFRKSEECPEVTVGWRDEWFGSCPYTLVRTWTATDATGAVEICIQTITVVDTQPPMIMNIPADVLVSCAHVPEASDAVWATDACKEAYPVMVDDEYIAGDCPGSYLIRRTYWSEDDCGNVGSAVQEISVVDMEAPDLNGVPADVTVECTAIPKAPKVEAFDGCDPNVEVHLEETIIPGQCAGAYTLVRTWSATDNCGNNATMAQTITVVDTQGPVFQCIPQDITVDCYTIPAPIECTAVDACSDQVDVTMMETKTGDGCKASYTITRTWTATDDCGNATTVDQLIHVDNHKLPFMGSNNGVGGKMLVNVAPNPFRDESVIRFTATETGHATIEVTDLQGRRVAELFNAHVSEGQPVQAIFRPVKNSSGAFIYRVTLNGIEEHGRLFHQP